MPFLSYHTGSSVDLEVVLSPLALKLHFLSLKSSLEVVLSPLALKLHF